MPDSQRELKAQKRLSQDLSSCVNKKARGRRAEQEVANYLKTKGYEIYAKGYQSGHLEIDIIATRQKHELADSKLLCFIECKYRKIKNENDFSMAFASVPLSKQEKIIRAAKVFLSRNPQFSRCFCRFDVALVFEITKKVGEQKEEFQLHYFENAFSET